MKLQIKLLKGKTHDIFVGGNETVEELKNKLQSFVNMKSTEQKLVFKGSQVLVDDLTLHECGVHDGDVVALLQRTPRKKYNFFEEEENTYNAVPTKTMINEATTKAFGNNKTPTKRTKPASSGTPQSTISNLRSQLQELMGSLVGFPLSSTSSSSNNDNEENEENTTSNSTPMNSTTQPSTSTSTNPPPEIQVDDTSLQQLKDMGFPEARAKKALILNNMNPQAAMEYILNHEDDPHIDDPLTTQQLNEISRRNAEFVPDPAAVSKLKDMGFSEEDITTALKACNNNSEAACSWLLGERDVEPISMDESSLGILNSVLTNPVVRSGLHNPRVVLALRALMEDPTSATQYLNDPEIGPVLVQVHNIMMQGGNQ